MHSYEPDMVDESQQNVYDKQPRELHKFNGFYNHIFHPLQSILPSGRIYYILLSAYELLTTLPTCYLLSHCQFEHSVYLGTLAVTK